MGTSYYDSKGEATFLFDGVPINAVKRATFKDKLGTVSQLIKMIYNGVTYDFRETAQGGAVIFADDFKRWEFIAPDDRLDMEGYATMTIGQALDSMETTLAANPIPAWEKFAEWLDSNTMKSMVGNMGTIWLLDATGYAVAQVNKLTFPPINSFLDILGMLQSCLAPAAGTSMSRFAVTNGYRCQLQIGTMVMAFTFRE